ncbi:MAG TPA: CpsD/CapB family tyrosine-protein kinase [Clostridia bacterium]
MQTKTFNVYNQKNQAVQDAYSMLASYIHLKNGENSVKSVAFTSCKPGVGKTTLCISLAVTMAEAGWKVLLVDTDIRKPSDAKRLNSDSECGLTDYLMGSVDLSNALCKTNISNLTYISCGKNQSNPSGLLCSPKFDEFFERTKNLYDFIILDTPSLLSVSDGMIVASKADATVLAAEAGVTDITGLQRAQKMLSQVEANVIGVVLNRVKKRQYRTYFESYNYFQNAKKFFTKGNDIVSKSLR